VARKSIQRYAASRGKAREEVPATEFKDSCLQLIERVQHGGFRFPVPSMNG
jgi:hypothetical protein